jgi:eukaryotic-like serine/threonine-protein kinase
MNYDIGSTVGDYQVVGIRGAGGMGKVYKVRNVISDRVEAMKLVLPDLANEPDLADRFLREIKLQASLKHPNIAALHTAVRVDNRLLMLMEFVEGETLEQKLKKGPLAPGPAVDYLTQALSALEYAHAHGVIHRDIKPANMILTDSGVIKLMDFGIAKAADDRKLTMTGTTMGSLYYMSPEQIQGSANLDARSDLYSVGVTLYELVTGKRPFDGDSQFSIMSAHLQNTPTPPIVLDPKLPQPLNDIILLAVTKDPDRRFQTAAAFANALRSVTPAAQPAVAAAPAPVAAAAPAKAAAPPAKESFHLIEPTTAPAQPSSKRGLWMALGAVAAVAVVVAAIQFGPWTHAAHSTAVPATPSPVVQPEPTAGPPPPAPASTPLTQPEPAAPAASPAAQTPVASQTPANTPAQASSPRSIPNRQTAPAGNRTPERAVQAPPQAVSPAPAHQMAPPPGAVAPSQAAAPPQAAANAPTRAELQQIREQLAMLASRAGGIRTSLQSLQRSQAASGLNLRGDMQEAASLMDSYFNGAAAALNAGDAGAAKSLMDKAERQVEKLEKFLNR